MTRIYFTTPAGGGGSSVNLSSPPPIGDVTPNTGAFTTLQLDTGGAGITNDTGAATITFPTGVRIDFDADRLDFNVTGHTWVLNGNDFFQSGSQINFQSDAPTRTTANIQTRRNADAGLGYDTTAVGVSIVPTTDKSSFVATEEKIEFYRDSSTDTGDSAPLAADIVADWETSTHASRKGRLRLYVSDAAGRREALAAQTDGSASMLGFYGTAPATKQTVSGSRGGNAALASLLTVLETIGLINDSTT